MKKIVQILLIAMGGLTACDSIDCTLNNTVECKMTFYNAEGKAVALADTLTITAAGTDSVLYNRGIRVSSVSLPLSYYKDRDTLTLHIYGQDYAIEEQLIIEKSNYEHFESLDCPVKMFHTINGVSSTHTVIDSVRIASPLVQYDNGENIKIYLHTGN